MAQLVSTVETISRLRLQDVVAWGARNSAEVCHAAKERRTIPAQCAAFAAR
ncbi:MAG: hypothetical protein WAK56_23860 [Candidatus Sulfotelmatobacter sp.]